MVMMMMRRRRRRRRRGRRRTSGDSPPVPLPVHTLHLRLQILLTVLPPADVFG